MNQGNTFCDKEQMGDLLSAEKFLASNYNTFLLESATPEMKQCLSALLTDTHLMQQQIFNTMQTRSWYPTPKAEDAKLQQTRGQYQSEVSK